MRANLVGKCLFCQDFVKNKTKQKTSSNFIQVPAMQISPEAAKACTIQRAWSQEQNKRSKEETRSTKDSRNMPSKRK